MEKLFYTSLQLLIQTVKSPPPKRNIFKFFFNSIHILNLILNQKISIHNIQILYIFIGNGGELVDNNLYILKEEMNKRKFKWHHHPQVAHERNS